MTRGVATGRVAQDRTAHPFTPLALNPALWVRADLGVTLTSGKVSTWADQSGHGRDFTQSNAGKRPTVTASAINGQPGILFGGAAGLGDHLITAAFSLTQPTTVLAVLKVVSIGTVNDALWDGISFATLLCTNNTTPQLALFAGAPLQVASNLATGSYMGIIATFSGVNSRFRTVESATVTSVMFGDAGAGAASGITLAAAGGTGGAANIEIAEFMVLSDELNVLNCDAWVGYVRARYLP